MLQFKPNLPLMRPSQSVYAHEQLRVNKDHFDIAPIILVLPTMHLSVGVNKPTQPLKKYSTVEIENLTYSYR